MNGKLFARGAAVALALGLAGWAGAADAKPFRFSVSGDAGTLDPHANNAGNTTLLTRQIYESLVDRDFNMVPIPGLAASWETVSPTVWRFKLRPGVKFHDGTTMTADDVVFSYKRAQAQTSNFRIFVDTLKDARRVDDLTVEFETTAPDPILLAKMTDVRIMSKAWAERHDVVQPQNFAQKQETYAVRNANGTGPFQLKERTPDTRTVLSRFADHWSKDAPKDATALSTNVTEAIFLPIANNATRVAALVSGEVDFVLDPPLQDLQRLSAGATKVLDGREVRTIFFGFDLARDELQYSDVKGKNPFKDARVRKAVEHAIDIEAIKTRIMRGYAIPTGSLYPEGVDGFTPDLDKRLPLDRDRAKALLAEAGYPNGFEVTLDCPNNRYVNDEEICTATASMLAQIGIRVKLNAMPLTLFFPKILKNDTSFYLLGWGVPTYDALYSFQQLMVTKGPGGNGAWNASNMSFPEFDKIVEAMRFEMDRTKRIGLIHQAMGWIQEHKPFVILHHQMIPWAMRANVTTPHRINNQMELKWTVVN